RPKAVPVHCKWDGERGVWTDGEFWFDEAAAEKAARFFPDHLVLTEAEWAGRPFDLADWQEHDIVRPVYGWKRPDGTRRYRRVFVWVPRKNGKTELAAGMAILMLVGDGEPAGQVYSIATNKEQAELCFNKAIAMVQRSPTLGQVLESYKTSV